MPDYHVGDLLVHADVPVLPSEDTLADDWAQIKLYGDPLWDRTFAETTRRTSLWTKRAGLLLFDRHQIGELPDLLRFLGVGDGRGMPSAWPTPMTRCTTGT